MISRIFIAGLVLLSLGAVAPTTTTRPSSRSGYSDHYGLLEERNIFLRERTSRRTNSRNSSTTQPSPRPPEEKFVLRGTVLEDEGYRAYVEDTDRFETLRLAPGDKLARGRVAAIMIDAIAYEPSATGSQRTWIEVGSDLTGKPSRVVLSSTSSSATTAPTTAPVVGDVTGLNPNDPNLTTQQRMMLRRAMELQKK